MKDNSKRKYAMYLRWLARGDNRKKRNDYWKRYHQQRYALKKTGGVIAELKPLPRKQAA